jgi:hypothetical protein
MEAFVSLARDEGFLTRLRIGLARLDLTIGPACHSSCTVELRWGTGGAGIPSKASIDVLAFANEDGHVVLKVPEKQKTRLAPRIRSAGS